MTTQSQLSEARATGFLHLVIRGYRSGLLPRGSGLIFDRAPARWWGGSVVKVPTSVGDLVLPVRDRGARQLLVFGEILHERPETALLRRIGPRLRSALDVGASYGWYARLLAQTMPAGAPITAVEANPMVVGFLRRNAGDRVGVTHAAIAAESGEIPFYVAESSGLSSSVRAVGERIMVPAVTIDELVGGGDAGLDFVKCDIEGGELAALRGSRAVRASARPPVWLIEINERFLREVGASLESVETEFARGGPVRYHQAVADGRLRPLPGGLRDLPAGFVNVVVVPERRAAEFADLVGQPG